MAMQIGSSSRLLTKSNAPANQIHHFHLTAFNIVEFDLLGASGHPPK